MLYGPFLSGYLKDEWSKWTKRFPNEFYKELFRLKGINFPSAGNQKPSYVDHWTNDIVYSRLKPGLQKRLKELNPRTGSGNRARKHHQHLTDDLGVPELERHLVACEVPSIPSITVDCMALHLHLRELSPPRLHLVRLERSLAVGWI